MGSTTEYLNSLAQRKGYRSHSQMYAIRRLLARGENAQQDFEDGMKDRGLMKGYEQTPDLDVKMDCEWALEILANRHYDLQGRVKFSGHPNPSGAREVRVIRGMIYEGRTLRDMGKELGITRERVRRIKQKGFEHLRDILVSDIR